MDVRLLKRLEDYDMAGNGFPLNRVPFSAAYSLQRAALKFLLLTLSCVGKYDAEWT